MNAKRIVLFVFAIAALPVTGSPQQAPHFDAASVKLVQWQMGNASNRADAGRIDFHQFSLQSMLLRAYPIAFYQIVWPTPTWVKDKAGWYDISATIPADTTKDQLQMMWRNLLKERFGLQAHIETRQLPVYAITVAPSGLRLHRTDSPPRGPDDQFGGIFTMPTSFLLKGDRPFSDILLFSGYLDRPLVDLTGLAGNYDFNLSVPRDSVRPDAAIPPSQHTPEMEKAFQGWDNAWFFTAMEKQLGLRVEKRDVPTEMLIIDHLNRLPTAN